MSTRWLSPGQQLYPTDVLALWFGNQCGQYVSLEVVCTIIDATYPRGDRHVSTENYTIFIQAWDGRFWPALLLWQTQEASIKRSD